MRSPIIKSSKLYFELQEEAIENIQEAIELYLEPAPITLARGAIIREITIG